MRIASTIDKYIEYSLDFSQCPFLGLLNQLSQEVSSLIPSLLISLIIQLYNLINIKNACNWHEHPLKSGRHNFQVAYPAWTHPPQTGQLPFTQSRFNYNPPWLWYRRGIHAKASWHDQLIIENTPGRLYFDIKFSDYYGRGPALLAKQRENIR